MSHPGVRGCGSAGPGRTARVSQWGGAAQVRLLGKPLPGRFWPRLGPASRSPDSLAAVCKGVRVWGSPGDSIRRKEGKRRFPEGPEAVRESLRSGGVLELVGHPRDSVGFGPLQGPALSGGAFVTLPGWDPGFLSWDACPGLQAGCGDLCLLLQQGALGCRSAGRQKPAFEVTLSIGGGRCGRGELVASESG